MHAMLQFRGFPDADEDEDSSTEDGDKVGSPASRRKGKGTAVRRGILLVILIVVILHGLVSLRRCILLAVTAVSIFIFMHASKALGPS